MDLGSAEARNRPVVKQLNCSAGPGVEPRETMDCLRNCSAEAIRAAVPDSWVHMDSFDFPRSVHGYDEAGVSIVDGATVVQGLEQAFLDSTSGRTIDVPLLIGTTAQEVEMCPPHDWRNVSQEQFMRVLNQTFSPWVSHSFALATLRIEF